MVYIKDKGEWKPIQDKKASAEIVRRMGEAIQEHYNQRPQEY